ncbi:MAG: hypothetical protein KGI69_01755 [Patescibacteria group bacterium]|nr:hypothetical protein [Patescibacteria group bacterium]
MKDLFTRSAANPIITPDSSGWWKIYNPGAALDGQGAVHLFPRAVKKEADWHSRILHAVSRDGVRFELDKEPVFERIGESELRGLEDPRVTFLDGIYHIVFAAYDGARVLLHSATAPALEGPWQRRGAMLPDFDFFKNGGKMVEWKDGKPVAKTHTKSGSVWNKSGALFPEKIGGKPTLIFGEYHMWLAGSDDGFRYEADPTPILTPRTGTRYFDNTFIEMGPPPMLTDKGWLVLYHGIDEAFRYQLGFVILDRHDVRKVLYRTDEPIFGPKEPYEMGDALIDVIKGGITAMSAMDDEQLKEFYKTARNENVMPQVTFCPGAVVKDEMLWLYYGAGDTSICMAHAPLQKLLDMVPAV